MGIQSKYAIKKKQTQTRLESQCQQPTENNNPKVNLSFCLSEWRNVPAGVPQGTKLGPWLFILMIDDINTSNTELWKYVDDTTIAECVDKKEDSRIQSDMKELIAKSNQNKFQLNESKCKELRISFAKSAADFAPIVINGKAIEVVSTVKLLGLNISSDLRRNVMLLK